MDKGTKRQLVQMQSLMERMEKHYTKDQANAYTEQKFINEGVSKQRIQVSRDKILDMLDRQDDKGAGRYVSFTYIKPVSVYKKRSSIDIPSVKGALDSYDGDREIDWYKSLNNFAGDETAKNNPISSIIVAQRYVVHWLSPTGYNKAYSAYASKLSNLRQKYGIARDTDGVLGDNHNQRSKDDWGTTNQTGNRSRDFNMIDSSIKITNYIVDETGHVISTIPNDIVKMISSQKKQYSVESEVAKALADNPEALQEYEKARAEISKDFKGQNFLLDRILSIVASVDGIDYYYINDKLLSPIAAKSETNVSQSEMIEIAKNQLQQSFNDISASEFAR